MTDLIETNFYSAILSQLWQVTVLIVVAAMVTRLIAKNRPHLAHVLWLVVLLKCITPPWFACPGSLFSYAEAWIAQSATPVAAPPGPLVTPACVDSLDISNVGNSPISTLQRVDSSSISWTTCFAMALFIAWTVGLLLVVLRMGRQWRRFLRLIRQPACHGYPEHEARFDQLVHRLGLRCSVRLLISAGRIGPAVVGWFRPVIVLPEMLLADRSVGELEPMLAHELIHLRRGDTWTGLLRVVTQAVWWFHPLVAWSGRHLSREAERCCDEAVVAELGLRPADYARCLLGVLERKHLLYEPVPACPGIRPVEVTSKRMERIMRLGHGSHKRSPRWYWGVLAVLAFTTLPGAPWVAADDADEPSVDKYQTEALKKASLAKQTTVEPASRQPSAPVDKNLSPVDQEPFVVVYEVKDLIEKIQTQLEFDESRAKQMLLDRIKFEFRDLPGKLDTQALRISEKGLTLIAKQTELTHSRIIIALGSMRDEGFQQIQLDILGIEAHADAVDPALTASLFAKLEPEAVETMLRQMKKKDAAQVFTRPTMRIINGQEGSLTVGEEIPLFIGFKSNKLDVKRVFVGTQCDIKPLLIGDNQVRVEVHLLVTDLRGVQTKKVKHPVSGEMIEIQTPMVVTHEIKTCVAIPLGQTVMILGPEQASGKNEAHPLRTLFAIRPTLPKKVVASKQLPRR